MTAVRTSTTADTLRSGDLVEIADGLVEVLGEPFLGQRGASPFDQRELYWRVPFRLLADGASLRYATLRVGERVVLCRRGSGRPAGC